MLDNRGNASVISTPKTDNSASRDVFSLGLAIFVLAAFIYVYHGTFSWLYERYTNPDSHYSHGFFVPFFSGYLIWRAVKGSKMDVLPASRMGLPLIILALLIHVGSVWTHVFFTSGFSILLLVVGVSLFLFGREFTRRISFALAFLIFMFPLPMGVIDAFSFPLKLKVASMAGVVLDAAGLPFFREGAVFHLARTTLTVDDPCSGIRSLFSLLAVGAWVAYSFKISTWKKVVLFLSTFPIAIFVNVLRVCALILAAQWWGAQWALPEHWFHTASGIGVFAVSLILLFLVEWVLEWKKEKSCQ